MAPTKAAGTAKKTTTRKPATPPTAGTKLRRDLARLVADVRTALDQLAVSGDLTTMEGRDRLQQQVDEVEARWSRVKQELRLAKSDSDATLETVRAALAKAEETVRNVVDAVFEGVRKH